MGSKALAAWSTSLLEGWHPRLFNFLKNKWRRAHTVSDVETASVTAIELSELDSTSTNISLSKSKTSQPSSTADADGSEPPEYQLIYLHCDGESSTVERLRSRLNDTFLLGKYDILTLFRIDRHLWELLVLTRQLPRFSRCSTHCGFAIEYHGSLRQGLFVRASVVRHQSNIALDTNPFLQEAADVYGELLTRYPRQKVLLDILGAVLFLPKSLIMGYRVYQRNWLHFI